MAVSPNDFLASFDPTAYVTVNGAQLLQLISGAFPFTDKGMIMSSDDVAGNPTVPNPASLGPDGEALTKWKNYFWRRQSATSVGVYVWNENAATDATYLKWVSINIAGIGAGSIINVMIADNTITDVKIASLSYSKLTGAPSGLAPSGAAGGALAGTYPNPSLAANAVVLASITDAIITGAKIAPKTISYSNILGNGVALNMMRATAADPTILEWFQPPTIFTSGVVVTTTGNVGLIPQVATEGAADGGTWAMVSAASIVNAGAVAGRFTSAELTVAVGNAANGVAHGLGAKPASVRAVLVCKTIDAGFAVGDELDLNCVARTANENRAVYSVSVNATTFSLSFDSTSVVLVACDRGNGVETTLTNARWKAKVYISL